MLIHPRKGQLGVGLDSFKFPQAHRFDIDRQTAVLENYYDSLIGREVTA